MRRKGLSIWLVMLLLFSSFVIIDVTLHIMPKVEADTWYVDDIPGGNPPEDFTSIQVAIDFAQPGDTVFVYNGIYYENIVVNKTISLIGEDRNTTIINGNGVVNVVYLTNADYINISNLGIRNGEIGIRIEFSTSNYNNISWNRIYDIFSTNNAYGIYGGAYSKIYQNIVYNVSTNGSDKDATGIAASLSTNVFYNTIYDIFSNSRHAIGIGIGSSNNVSFNNIYNVSSNGSIITGSIPLTPKAIGINVVSSNNNITSNHIHNVFTTNIRENFAIGIYLYEASYNNVISNYVYYINSSYDEVWGISLRKSSNYNNIISNFVYNLSSPDFVVSGIFAQLSSNYNNILLNHIMNLTNNFKAFGIEISGCSYNNLVGNSVYNIITSGDDTGDAVGIMVTIGLNYFNKVILNQLHDIHSTYAPTIGIMFGSQSYSDISSNLIYDISCSYSYAAGIRSIGSSDFNNITSNSIWNIESTNFDAYGILLEWNINLYYNIGLNEVTNISGGRAAHGIFLNETSNYNNLTSNHINNISSPTGVAYGMDFRDASYNIIDNCTINNTKSGVHFDELSMDNIFINSSISNTEIYDFHFDDDFGGDSHTATLNTTFNKTRVSYEDTLSNLTVKWFMHVKVIYFNGTPVSNAEIWVNDTYGNSILEGPTDPEGWTKWIVVTEYVEQDFNGDHVGERTYFTPHDVTATDGELWGYASPHMDISKVVVIVLGLETYLLPPTNLTTKVVNNGNNVELEWDPVISPALDHYLIYRGGSSTDFDFTMPYNSSTTWPNPKNTTWVDPDPIVTAFDDDFYYIVRAANSDESDISTTSNTAGVWTRTFQAGASTFSLPMEPFMKKDTEFYCQEMNASYIKWMNQTTHTWMRHDRGSPENNTIIEVGRGYEIGFEDQTRYTFTGMPGAMVLYDNVPFGFDATPLTGNADSLTATVDSDCNVTLNWTQPANMGSEDGFYVLRSSSRDGFWGTLGVNYTQLAVLSFDVLLYQDIGNATPGSEYYYMIVPINLSTGKRGVSSYSIGVWTASYLKGYDTFGLPLKPEVNQTVDWYCDNINNTVGINYFDYLMQRWSWHSKRMPEGAFDPIIEIGLGYQISTSSVTKYSFVGV